MKRTALIAALLSFALLPAFHARAQEDGNGNVWQDRNKLLVSMSGLLGSLHHHHSICRPGRNWRANLYRDRMLEMIRLEEPYETVEQQMIDAFNTAYLGAQNAYPSCTAPVEQEMRRLALEGEDMAYRLGAPFRQVQGYDYDAGGEFTIENGVRVYRQQD